MAATDRQRPAAGPGRSRILLLGLALVVLAAPAHADRASGTWTGAASLWGNYYWEESTRVVAPSVDLELEAPSGLRMNGHYLVDTITSASQASGTNVDVSFTEVRHDFTVGGGYEIDLGDKHLDVGLLTRHSFEPDYRSTGAGLSLALSLLERTTVLRLNGFYLHDEIRQKIRGAPSPDGRGSLSDRGKVGELDGLATSFVWEQILSPVFTMQLGYDLGYLTGLLANPYRRVSVEGAPRPETHPSHRLRHTMMGRVAYFVRPSRTALHLIYRTYRDSFRIGALNPEVRVYQEVGAFTVLRFRYRYYIQTAASFYEANPADYTAEDTFVTADPKMSAFDSHLVGVNVLLLSEFLADTSLDVLRDATLDLTFDYIWRSNRYGNGVIAQIGLRAPF